MSSHDETSSRALAALGLEGLRKDARVLIGGLGLGYTAAEALERLSENAIVEVAELVPAVVDWSRRYVGHLAGSPLDDPRTVLLNEDVAVSLQRSRSAYDAILLDVDNGPEDLAHESNAALYTPEGLRAARRALRPGGALAVWSFSDDRAFTRRLRAAGFDTTVHRVLGSRRGRGRYHWIWVARCPGGPAR
jgi:spermidine synthase